MNTHDTLRNTKMTSSMVLKTYLSDLSDADLMTRPGPGCNHLAWQLGHLIASECSLVESVQPGAAADLPEGFAEQHSKETIAEDDPAKFCSKADYLELFDKVEAASLAALAKLSESDLDAAAPEHFRERFPTVGHVYVLIATHAMMHAGQFVPVRRALDKAILM